MEKEIKVGLHNRFDFVRRDAKTDEVLEEYFAENIILDNFWAIFLSNNNNNCLKYIHFGSGTTTPTASDVKLGTWIGYKTAPTYSNEGTVYDFSKFYSDGITSVKKSIRLEDTDYVGEYISEVGYSSSTSGTSGLLTKALVKDMNGNVVSIEKKSGEVLDIFATFYVKHGTSFNDGSIIFTPIDLTATTSLSLLNHLTFRTTYDATYKKSSWSSYKSQPQSNKGGTASDGANVDASITYTSASKKIEYAMPNAISSEQNLGGLKCLWVGNDVCISVPCTGFAQPVLTKEVVGTGDGSNKAFNTSFGWIKDNSTLKVYVDDTEVSATALFDIPVPTTPVNKMLTPLDWTKFNADGTPAKGYGIINNNGVVMPVGNYTVFENPLYATVGIDSIKGRYMDIYYSDNNSDWTKEGSVVANTTLTIGTGNKNKRYWKFVSTSTNSSGISEILSASWSALKLINLSSAPANGSVVSVTYQPDCLAKDTDHVINNVKVTLTFNEYTPT